MRSQAAKRDMDYMAVQREQALKEANKLVSAVFKFKLNYWNNPTKIGKFERNINKQQKWINKYFERHSRETKRREETKSIMIAWLLRKRGVSASRDELRRSSSRRRGCARRKRIRRGSESSWRRVCDKRKWLRWEITYFIRVRLRILLYDFGLLARKKEKKKIQTKKR